MASELEKLGCPREKIKVFHLGTDVSGIKFKERNIKKGDPINLLFVATLTEKKGCEYLIRAYAKVVDKNPNLNLKIIGQGELKTQLIDLAKDLSVYDKITFENYIPYSKFIEELGNADIFISPSVTAANGNTEGGAPVSLIDAQAAGLAIISSFHADIPEVVINEQTGLLANERDTDKIAEHILYFANNPEEIAAFGRRGRKHVEEEYNITYQGQKLSKIYTDTISRYKKRD
jgi:colanic acid/amylovoran biosynthesis glycosyltransferase